VLDYLKNDLNVNVSQLSGTELLVLLWLKLIPMTNVGSMANKQVLYQKCVDNDAQDEKDGANIPAQWTDTDEARLEVLMNMPVLLGNIVHGPQVVQKKRDAKRAYQKMLANEKEAFQKK
jgi:hypothetical protein